MGRKSCYSRTYSGCCAPACAPACGFLCPPPCCPPPCGPFFGPCCPPPCGPFLPPCCPQPCYDDCYDCCEYKSSFSASTDASQNITSSATVTFTESTDCAGEYSSNTFTPRCQGCYKFHANVQIQNIGGETGTFYLNLVVGSSPVYQVSATIAPLGIATLTIDKTITLQKGQSVTIGASSSGPAFILTQGYLRTFTGRKLTCKSNCSSCC